MSTATPKHFDTDVRNRLGQVDEIQIETRKPGATAPTHRTTIWVVVDGDNVHVRSVRGNAGRWYQEITANPSAAVHVNGKRIPVRAIPVRDDATIKRASEAYRKKYSASSSLPSMIQDDILQTTLRLEPQ